MKYVTKREGLDHPPLQIRDKRIVASKSILPTPA
jgi:hypothetical protein